VIATDIFDRIGKRGNLELAQIDDKIRLVEIPFTIQGWAFKALRYLQKMSDMMRLAQ